MKKLLVWVLLVVLTLNFCACSAPENTEEGNETTAAASFKTIQAGYSIIKITPEESVPLAGYGNTSLRMSNNVLSDLYATCLALTDETGNTVLLISMDLQRASDTIVKVARPLISQATGVPEDHIMITATHTHSGPDMDNAMPVITRYLEKLNKEWLPQVAREAMADRMDAQVSIGSTETDTLNFVRHYTNVDAAGNTQYFGDNFGTTVIDETTKHTTEVDQTMHLVQFTREGGKPIVLANWRAHPCLTGGNKKYDISADYVGAFRKNIEKMYKCQFIYFQGAAGNVNATSRITSEMRTNDYAKHGELLALAALKCLRENMAQVDPGLIQTSQTLLDAEFIEITDELLAGARVVQSIWNTTNDRAQAIEAGKPYGIRSPYHANAIVSLGYTSAKSKELELNAITIGGSIALVTAPHELFDTNSVWLEENSPYAMTLTLGYANGNNGYIPSKLAFEYSCYESDVCKFKEGIGETIQENFLSMLQALSGKK